MCCCRVPQLADCTDVMQQIQRRKGTRYTCLTPNIKVRIAQLQMPVQLRDSLCAELCFNQRACMVATAGAPAELCVVQQLHPGSLFDLALVLMRAQAQQYAARIAHTAAFSDCVDAQTPKASPIAC